MNAASVPLHRPASPSAVLWKVILLGFPLFVGTIFFFFWLRQTNELTHRPLNSLGKVPEFRLTNQNGQPFGSQELRGKIWMADFIYTTCPGPCPMISSRMSETQKPLRDTDVKLVSFSVDPAHDTPAVLRGYAEKLSAQPGRWEFLTGNKTTIEQLSRDGFKLAVGSNESGQPIHSTRVILVDRAGEIRGYYDATEADAVTRLLADAHHLLREQPAP
jgi:protein SCO1